MKILSFLSLLIIFGEITQPAIASQSVVLRAEDKVYITELKPKSKVKILVERIHFRSLVADSCGEVSLESSSTPSLILVEKQEFNPAKFKLEATRICTKNSPKSDRSYKTSDVIFVLAGLKPQKSYLVKIIKPSRQSLTTNRCGYGAIAINQTLTAFANSYEDNIYRINGKKLKDLPIQKPPKC